MIDETITTSRPFPIGAIFWGVAAGILIAGGAATKNIHLGIGAILPALCSVGLFLARRPRFAARCTDEGLDLLRARTLIRYDEIEGVSRPRAVSEDDRAPRSFPIRVFHSRGYFTIPGGLNRPSAEVYEFLSARARGGSTNIPVNPELRDYLARQEHLFGADKVWVYRGRAPLQLTDDSRGGRVVGVATLLASIVWIILALSEPSLKAWGGAGLVGLFVGATVFLLFWLWGGPRRRRGWRQACLIIGPAGLALVQRHLRGELAWEELRDVKFRDRPAAFGVTRADVIAGIVLRVEGAQIVILDMYHRPLREIHHRIMDYWQ